MTTTALPELLQGLDAAAAHVVLAMGSHIQLSAGAVLFPLGAPAENLYLIERGRIALTLPIEVGGRDEDILVEERLEGETVGWSALVPPHRFTLKATALIDTELLVIPRGLLLEHLNARPEVGHRVAHNVALIIGHRLQLFQAMWLREMQRFMNTRVSLHESPLP